jgi:hypothetical protein
MRESICETIYEVREIAKRCQEPHVIWREAVTVHALPHTLHNAVLLGIAE